MGITPSLTAIHATGEQGSVADSGNREIFPVSLLSPATVPSYPDSRRVTGGMDLKDKIHDFPHPFWVHFCPFPDYCFECWTINGESQTPPYLKSSPPLC